MASTTITQLNVSRFVATSTTATSSIPMLEVGKRCKNCVTGYEIVNGGTTAGPTTVGSEVTESVDCTSDKKVIGGGADLAGTAGNALIQSYPSDSNTWTAIVECLIGGGCTAGTIAAYAICVDN